MGDICKNKHRGNVHSVAAYNHFKPNKEAKLKELHGYISNKPSTTEEAAHALNWRYTTVSALMSELKSRGRAEEIDERPTTSGRNAGVIKGI